MPRKTVSMEEAFQELDAILEKLEGKDISLEDSFALYQKGMELVKTCNSKIDTVGKMKKVTEEQHRFWENFVRIVRLSRYMPETS